MVELDGGQRANSLGLMVHQAIKCKLHVFSESEVSPMERGSWLDEVGDVNGVGFPQLWVSRLGRGV